MMDISHIGAFLAGLLSFLSPCVLPLVPPYLAWIAGVSLNEISDAQPDPAARRRVTLSALVFVLGFATVFVSLGATASTLGRFVAEHLDTLSKIAGVIIILMGLNFLGLFRIGLFSREARVEATRRPVGLPGAYAVGLAFGFGWTPCVGPVLAAILFTAAQAESSLAGAGLLAAYAFGMGAPFVVAALFMGPFMRFMARFRRHLGLIEKIIGGLLVIVGILFVTGGFATLSWRLLEAMPWLGTIG